MQTVTEATGKLKQTPEGERRINYMKNLFNRKNQGTEEKAPKKGFKKKLTGLGLAGIIAFSVAGGAGASSLIVGVLSNDDESSLTNIKYFIDTLSWKVKDGESDKQYLIKIVNEKKGDIQALVTKRDELQKLLDSGLSETEKQELLNQLAQLNSQINTLTTEKNTLQNQLNDKDANYQQLEADYKLLQQKLNEMEEYARQIETNTFSTSPISQAEKDSLNTDAYDNETPAQ